MENYMNYSDDINNKISLFMSKLTDPEVYSEIMADLFTRGLFTPSVYINSFSILPGLNTYQLQTNFKNNINKIKTFLQTSIQENTEIYYVLSCIYGAFLGDAMGAFCEFEKPSPKNSRTIFNNLNTVIGGVKGQVTDDSEMALSLAYAIMDTPMKETLNVNYMYFYYGAWFRTNPLDFGNTTKNALKYFDFRQFHPKLNNFKKIEGKIMIENRDSLSNGFLMRKSTFIAWIYYRFYHEISDALNETNSLDKLFQLYLKIKLLSNEDNKITNPNEQVNVVSSIYTLMALMAIKGYPAKNIIDMLMNFSNYSAFLKKGNDEKYISKAIKSYIDLFNSHHFEFYKSFGDLKSYENVYNSMGFYLHAFKLTLYFLYNFDNIEKNHPEKKYRGIMNMICDLGGDTDTNCCIVGAVIGPLIGMNYFGYEFKQMLDVIPPNRPIYSIHMAILFVLYLNKSNRDSNLVMNDKYFLQQLLTMIYGNIDLSY